ncbi:MAG: GGDEF domain-containing protein [Steroidobacteraceae bacterium]
MHADTRQVKASILPRKQASEIMQGKDFENRLKAQVDFPSPSRVATEIVTLARDPDIEMAKVAQAVGQDPAMAAKILRIANSAFFSQRRPSQNLRQALIVIGLNAALTLALSFSLVSTFRTLRPQGIDYPRFWRRALLAATAARAFGQVTRTPHDEELFLAGLLQDMGVLAIDRIARDLYGRLAAGADHSAWIECEDAVLGHDHAYYTYLMLKTWNLPDRLCEAIHYSHSPESVPPDTADGQFVRCLAMGSELAEAVLATTRGGSLASFMARAHQLTSLSHEEISEVVTRVVQLIPETEQLYETSILPGDDAESLLAEARELLAVRNLQALQEVSALQATANVLLSRTEEIEDASRRDPLTGALNRAWLDRLLEREFTEAAVLGRNLSIASIDLDHFKLVNEKHGPQIGDEVLKACAKALQGCVRNTDIVARYAGEEFVVVLPGTDLDTARQVAERMQQAIASVRVASPKEHATTTASIGVVSCTPKTRYAHVTAFLEAADHALYTAKLRGRNRVEALTDPPPPARTVAPRQA